MAGIRSRVTVLLALTLSIAACGLLENDTKRPWVGYAWNKEKQRYEWWFINFETRRDCIEMMRYKVKNEQPQWYSEPIGCGYHGNNYWLVWVMNTFFGDEHIQCIWKSTDPDSVKAGIIYGPLLTGYPRQSGSGYCV